MLLAEVGRLYGSVTPAKAIITKNVETKCKALNERGAKMLKVQSTKFLTMLIVTI